MKGKEEETEKSKSSVPETTLSAEEAKAWVLDFRARQQAITDRNFLRRFKPGFVPRLVEKLREALPFERADALDRIALGILRTTGQTADFQVFLKREEAGRQLFTLRVRKLRKALMATEKALAGLSKGEGGREADTTLIASALTVSRLLGLPFVGGVRSVECDSEPDVETLRVNVSALREDLDKVLKESRRGGRPSKNLRAALIADALEELSPFGLPARSERSIGRFLLEEAGFDVPKDLDVIFKKAKELLSQRAGAKNS